MSAPLDGMTPLQAAQRRHAELLLTERERLSGEQYPAYIASELVRVAREAARLELGDLLRTLREEPER